MLEFTAEQLYSDDSAAELFARLLEERTSLMDQIDGLDARIRESAGVMEQDTLATIEGELHNKILKLQSQNELLEKVIKDSLDHLRGQAQKLQDGKQSNRAYVGRRPS